MLEVRMLGVHIPISDKGTHRDLGDKLGLKQ